MTREKGLGLDNPQRVLRSPKGQRIMLPVVLANIKENIDNFHTLTMIKINTENFFNQGKLGVLVQAYLDLRQ